MQKWPYLITSLLSSLNQFHCIGKNHIRHWALLPETRTKNSLLSPMQNSFCSTNQIDSVRIYIAPLEGAAITENHYQYSKSKWIFVISSHFKLYEQGITAELLGILALEFNSHCNHENSYISFDIILDLLGFSRSFG